jgi:thiamine kinase-like enzyme
MQDHTSIDATTVQLLLNLHELLNGAMLVAFESRQRSHDGSGGNSLFDLDVVLEQDGDRVTRRFLLKQWTSDSTNALFLTIDRSIEALAFEAGLFSDFPTHIGCPIVAALHQGPGENAWILMEDVSEGLAQYGRGNPHPFDIVVAKLKTILLRMAEFHIHWEAPKRTEVLNRSDWLIGIGQYLEKDELAYRHAFHEPGVKIQSRGRDVDTAFVAAMQAFVAWLPDSQREPWQHLLADRRPLLDAARSLPRTLIHGDMDDRNVGFSQRAADGSTGLTLVDWEWMAFCPGGFDVAKLLHQMNISCTPSTRVSDRYFETIPAMTQFYLDSYRKLGGRMHEAEVRRGVELGLICEALCPMPKIIGEVLLARSAGLYSASLVPGMETTEFDLLLEWGAGTAAYVGDLIDLHLG